MNFEFRNIEKTGKEEFIERLMNQIPEGQEIKLATLELSQDNEDNQYSTYINELERALNYTYHSTYIDTNGDLIVKFRDGKELKIIVCEIGEIK